MGGFKCLDIFSVYILFSICRFLVGINRRLCMVIILIGGLLGFVEREFGGKFYVFFFGCF